jgi:HEAT repeat protein
LDYASNSEYLIWLAKYIGITSLLMVIVVSCLILLLRMRLVRRERRDKQVHQIWQPVLVSCLDGSPEKVPELSEKDIKTFLVLWNYFHETLREAGKDNLNVVARKLQLDSWSMNALHNGSIRERLLAIQTIGWLHEDKVWDDLIEIMQHGDPVTSLCAAKAILRINPKKGIGIFIPLAATKAHWSYSTVGKLLKETGAEIVSDPLIDTASKLEGVELVRLLRFLKTASEEKASPLISKLLRESDDVNVLAACLRAVEDPDDLPTIREHLKHKDWKVRTQAAICLGHIGTEADVSRLIHAAGDQEWWVRYRAAIALAELPSMTIKRLKQIAADHQNPFGNDVITKVWQEKEAYQ